MSRGCVSQFFTQINDEVTLLRIVSNNPVKTYEFTTVVDTSCVELLKDFKWAKINTPDGIYFGSWAKKDAYAKWHKQISELKEGKQVTMHRLICSYRYENPMEYKYVDHINRRTLDNRSKNLRWATQSTQNENMDKKERPEGAKPLPTDISVTKLPKYMTWNPEEKRRFFRVEGHPALFGKTWTTSKANSVSNQEKYNHALAKLEELDTQVDPEPNKERRLQLLSEFNAIMGIIEN
jgi:hypothetical protein